MLSLLVVPFAAQGAVMFCDEFYCHQRRGLPLWERIGHPLDTLTFVLCFAVLVFLEPTATHLNLYIGCAVFSCLFVTKDEFVHQELCDGFEHWLHALLFVLHPIVLFAAGFLWKNGQDAILLRAQFTALCVFLIYQISYQLYFHGGFQSAKNQ